MRRWRSLLRAAMSEGMRLFRYRAKDEKSKRALPIFLASVLWLSIFGYAETMMASLKTTGTEFALLSIFTLFTAVMTLIEGIYKSGSLMFSCRDNDLLMSLPLGRSTIVFLRVFKFYVFEVIYNALFLTPALVVYPIQVRPGMEFLAVAAVMIFVLPIIPVVMASAVGAITTALSTRFAKKNLAQTLLSFVFLAAALGLSVKIGQFTDGVGEIAAGLSARIETIYYPARVVVRLATEFDALMLLRFITINLVVMAAFVIIAGKFYFRIISRVNVGSAKTKTKKVAFSSQTQTGALVRKEIRRYFNTPVLVTNTWIGLLIFLVAVGAVCLKADELAAKLVTELELGLTAEEIFSYAPAIATALVAFSSLLTYIATTMISLEGATFNLLKTLPVSGLRVLMGKVLAALVLTVPALIVGSLAMAARFKFGAAETVLVLLSSLLLPLATELFGILVDLRYARFDAESDAETVKQSTGVMVSSFTGLGMVILTISLFSMAVVAVGQIMGMAILCGVYLLICLGLLWRLKKRGERRYGKLVAD
ncbi:hypothetical protein IJ095_01860 [Candidatus Saccharibacteria bacterium]|nr:hypothetical protein [Candidatus Saccharibacteria bacterium]